MITLEIVIGIHAVLIKRYGGSPGIRDEGALQSAVSRPFQTFDCEELYKTTVEKAAALIESLVKNQKDVKATEEKKYEFVINIANGKSEYKEIKQWIEEKLVKWASR